MHRRLPLLGLLTTALALSQTAIFPGSVVTDSQMMVAKDNCQSTTTQTITNASTSVTVSNGSCFVSNTLLIFGGAGGEQAQVCSVSGNTLNFGHSSCPNVDGRGFAGTVAGSHLSGTVVSLNVTSWFRNVDRVELEAIESTLGANLSNIDYQTIQRNGVSLTQRPTLNFIPGANTTLTIADNAGNFSTDITITATPGSTMVYPPTGVPQSLGNAWGTSLIVGTAANNLVQLNGSGALPAVSAANLTGFPTFNQNTTGQANTALNLASYPTLCGGGQFSQGLSSGSNNCGTPAGGGASAAYQLLDFQITGPTSGNTVLTIGSNCGSTTPCEVKFNGTSYRITQSATATISAGSATAYFYLDSATGAEYVATTGTVACSAGCTQVSGSAFPNTSVPLYTWSSSSGTWNVGGGTDYRAVYTNMVFAVGAGITQTVSPTLTTFGADFTVIPQLVATPGTSSTACTAGAVSYDSSFWYVCIATNTWKRTAISTF